MISFFAAPYERSLSVIMTRGARHCFFSSLRNRRLAALVLRRLWTRASGNDAVLVDGAPQVMLLARDGHDQLIQVPLVAAAAGGGGSCWRSRGRASDPICARFHG
jgi:hypothetical protein